MLACCITVALSLAFPQSGEGETQEPKLHRRDAWVLEEWTGNSAPFTKKQKEIEKIKADQSKLYSRIDSLLARQKPTRPLTSLEAFELAFAAYSVASLDMSYSGTKEYQRMQRILVEAQPFEKRVYKYDRLLYIYEASSAIPKKHRFILAERLLKKDPKDVLIKYWYVRMLANGDEDSFAKGMELLPSLYKEMPDKTAMNWLAGFMYRTKCAVAKLKGKKASVEKDRLIAIDYLNKFLDAVPNVHRDRKSVERMIKQLTDDWAT